MTWRRAQMVLLSAQGMDVVGIAQVMFTSPDRVRDVLHNLNSDGFDSVVPTYGGGRRSFTLPQRQIKKTALARPTDHGLPFWTMRMLACSPVHLFTRSGWVPPLGEICCPVLVHVTGR